MKKVILITLVAIFCHSLQAQDSSKKDSLTQKRLEWFKDAKLGIFIHWGYYGVNGITESWSLYHKRISHKEYLKQGEKFTAQNFNPEQWAQLFKETGANYVVMTTKHHDGVALWDTQYSKLNTVDHAAAQQDLVTPYVQALQNKGLKVGLYFSLCDWSHPDYSPTTFERENLRNLYPISKEDKRKSAWERFVDFNFGQLKELSTNFHPDLFWFDGDWEHKAEEWHSKELKDSLLQWNPHVIVNSRLNEYGDYKTPEQGVPITHPEGAWEFCMTMNDNWGYFPTDNNYKPNSQIIRTFVEVISGGGNLLLNIGPKPDGTIASEQLERLKTLGKWIGQHKEAVYSTKAGLPYGHFYGPTLLSKDSKTVYLCLFDKPQNYIQLKGIQTKVKSIEVLETHEKLSFVRNGGAAWNNIPGILRISIPSDESINPFVTIIKVELEAPLQLYRGHGNAVELNN